MYTLQAGKQHGVAVLLPEVAPCLTGQYGKQPDSSNTSKAPMPIPVPQAFGGNNQSGPIEVSTALNAHGGPPGRLDFESETFIASPVTGRPYADRGAGDAGLVTHTLRGEGFDASEDGTGRGEPLVPVDITNCRAGGDVSGTIEHAQEKGNRGQGVIAAYAFQSRIARNGRGDMGDVVNALNAESGETGKGDAAPLVAIGFHGTQDPDVSGDVTHPLGCNHGQENAIAFSAKDYAGDAGEIPPTLRAGGFDKSHANGGVMPAALIGMRVRRLTPRECEYLQGFKKDYTLILTKASIKAEADYLVYLQAARPDLGEKELTRLSKDGPRYKVLGNSWAVPNARWIGERIDQVQAILDRSTIRVDP